MGFGWILGIWVLVVAVYLIGLRPEIIRDLFSGTGSGQSPLDIVKERYARGEISKEVYDQLREDLS